MGDISHEQYRELAEFRRLIRQFLHFSEAKAKEHSVEPQQYQLLLLVHGLPEGAKPTIREIASRLFVQHQSAVELVDRAEASGLIERSPSAGDRREVWVSLTPEGRRVLRSLALAHRDELERSSHGLARALNSMLRRSRTAVS